MTISCKFLIISIPLLMGVGVSLSHSTPIDTDPTTTMTSSCKSKDFTRIGTSCYYFSSEIVSWQEAHFRCRDKEAQLAVLETMDEDSVLRNFLQRPEFAQLGRWIGGMWVSGLQRKWVWAAQGDEIENGGGFANRNVLDLGATDQWMCLYMDPNNRYRWSNENCIRQLHYICEEDMEEVKPEVDGDNHDEVAAQGPSKTTEVVTTTTTTTTTEDPLFGMMHELYEDLEEDERDDMDDSDDSEDN